MCFQLPALVTGGLTVVVTPLVSLMVDQGEAPGGGGGGGELGRAAQGLKD
jgi:superfamily II DNA helicase RecQ